MPISVLGNFAFENGICESWFLWLRS